MNKRTIPMLDLKREYEYMKADIDQAIKMCLEHQQWILGPEVKDFEDKVAEYIGVKHCIGTSSGTDALVLALRALAIKTKGQEYFDRSDVIITTPFTFTATGDVILRAGATPLFVDIDPVTFNIDPAQILSVLCSKPSADKIVGILPVHLYGQSCQMDEIMAIAREHKLFVLEDVAQAFGASWNGKKLGSIGTVGAFSFFPSKNLGGFGDAGMVSTNDDKMNDLVRMLIKHGGKDKYNVDHIGYNARIDTLQAAILLEKFKYLEAYNLRRRHIAFFYTEGLKDIKKLSLPLVYDLLPFADTASSHIFHQYTIRVLDGTRDALQKNLKEHDVDSMVYYPVPLHQMKVFSGRSRIYNTVEKSEKAVSEVLSLPIEPLLNEEDILLIITAVKNYYR